MLMKSLQRAAFLGLAAFATSASAFLIDIDTTDVQEYVNDLTGHYFLVSEAYEKQFIDSGSAGPGWHPTGHRFSAYAVTSTRLVPVSRGSPVCRFYAGGPNTHFFTASTYECDLLRTNGWGWTYEGIHFRAETPVNGVCASGLAPISRLYNNRFQFNDSNHRYVAEPALRDGMVRQGWTDEGVVFCSSRVSYSPMKSFTAEATAIRPVAECENEDANLGSCIGMNGLSASLPTHIVNWVPPTYVTHGPQWSQAYADLTGSEGDVFTAQPADDTPAVLAHSFVQRYPFASSGVGGMHVSSVDAGSPLASVEPLYQFSTRAPAAGAADARVFPWRAPRENFLDVSFNLTVKTARRADPQSHAYGAPMIEFRDTRSGGAIDVTMLTFATFPSGSFVSAMDPTTGNVFVSTSFTESTTFGKRLSGDFISCDGNGACASTGRNLFQFRISKDDFAKIVSMARGSNPTLSQDVNDYLLVNFRFRSGILGNADLGDSLDGLGIGIYGY